MVDAHPGVSGIYPLPDARDAFAARALLAQGAERTLDVQYYIWRNDMSGTLLFEALRAAAEVCLGRSDLEGLRVAVQGLGNVGMPLCGYLSAAGAALVVSDLDGNRCAQAAATYGATLAAPEEIHAQHVDVFVPAALGAVLNDATIPGLRCRVVCGGANNQLAEARHDAALAVRGIVFVPDYLANAGGVIDFHQETIDDQPAAVLASVARIGAITRGVLRCAAATGATPLSVADDIVRARIIRRA